MNCCCKFLFGARDPGKGDEETEETAPLAAAEMRDGDRPDYGSGGPPAGNGAGARRDSLLATGAERQFARMESVLCAGYDLGKIDPDDDADDALLQASFVRHCSGDGNGDGDGGESGGAEIGPGAPASDGGDKGSSVTRWSVRFTGGRPEAYVKESSSR